jgi:hypothetical protein
VGPGTCESVSRELKDVSLEFGTKEKRKGHREKKKENKQTNKRTNKQTK